MLFVDDILHWLKGSRETESVVGERFFPLPLLVCDKGLSILRANPAFARHFKLDERHLKGKPVLQILGEDIKVIEEKEGRLIQERQVSKFGGLLEGSNPKTLRGNFLKIGQRVFRLYTRKALPVVSLVFEDITRTKELDDKIQKSRRELLSIFDGIEDPMVMIDKNYRIRRINEAMLKALGGTSYQSFIGKACYYKLHGMKERCLGCTADKTFATGKKTSRMGLLQARKDNENFNYQITYYPLRGATDTVTSVAECYRDVTDVKKIEEELFESERGRIMEPLAAGIAHEIRNPLAIIRSTAQYCLGEIGENKDLRESLQTIIGSTESANRVVIDLLNFARPQQAEFMEMALKPVLEHGLRLIRARAKEQRVRISRSISKRIPRLFLDEKRFLQAFMNLLVNSLDAMLNGGRLQVQAQMDHHGKLCVITLKDTGNGVPEEMISKLFQPFYSTKKEGVGLGLPLAEAVIRSHGGRISFKSWKGKGSEVEVVLPIRRTRVVVKN